jgi:hypothetical protein
MEFSRPPALAEHRCSHDLWSGGGRNQTGSQAGCQQAKEEKIIIGSVLITLKRSPMAAFFVAGVQAATIQVALRISKVGFEMSSKFASNDGSTCKLLFLFILYLF